MGVATKIGIFNLAHPIINELHTLFPSPTNEIFRSSKLPKNSRIVIKSANIWKPEFTHVDDERSKSKVRQLRTEQVNLCATLNKWRTAKNEANLAASVLLLYSFSKSKLVDIKNYMGGKRKEATAEIVNKAYKYMLENI